MPRDHAREEVGLRELKQNPSAVISRAEAGTQFNVTRNGKPTNVVIQLNSEEKKRWVSAADLAEIFSEVGPDRTGWLAELDSQRNDDPVVDPWSNGP